MDPAYPSKPAPHSSMDDDFFAAEIDEQANESGGKTWKILVVDDDEHVHSVTRLVLNGFEFEGKKLEILDAYSGKDAIHTLSNHQDVALVLLDVVMENDTAGLDVAKRIRQELKNQTLRIVLRTGQPGQAPEQQVIVDYDINDYKDKTELTAQKLMTLTYSNLRSFRDILEVQHAREQLEEGKRHIFNIINSMPSAIIGINAQKTITDWNLQAFQMTGQPFERVADQPVFHILPCTPEVEKVVTGVLEQGLSTHVPEAGLAFQEGQHRHYAITGYPLHIGKTIGAVLRFDDITSKIQLEKIMVQSEKMMTIGGLAAGMAHEIKNPLGVIVQNSQNVINRLDPQVAKNREIAHSLRINMEDLYQYLEKRNILKYLESIRLSVDRALDIITKMLRFGRNDATELQLHAVPEILEEALGFVANDYELKKTFDFQKAHIIKEYDPNLPPIPCARTALIQVILNLVKNAAQAMPVGLPNPTVTLTLQDLPDRMRLKIADNGAGIEPHVFKSLFTPFFTTKSDSIGTGLGLSVCRFIITELHHGRISVESTLGEGTCFTIEIPKIAGKSLKEELPNP